MAIATTAVAVVPVVIVWWLRDAGTITSPWICIGLAIALSLLASVLGSAFWQRCSGSGDVFFSELMLWGWLHRLRGERRLAKTAGRLGLSKPGHELVGPNYELAPGADGLERTARLLRQMAAALDAQDPYTDGHSRRVALHSAMVARKMGLERDEIAKVRTAAAVHDIGKLRIPPELLNKPGDLSEEEFEIVKRHADDGAEIVSCMEDPEITGMVRHHHERFDGAGYPSGLKGEETPLGARIIAVADTFDALTSVRPYRTAIAHKRALEAIVAVSGTQLDPAVVRAFLRCYSGNRAVFFWTLLAVSPQRALALIPGKNPGRGNFASTAATVATPAALAAVVASAFGTAGGVATANSPLVAQRPTGQAAVSASSAHVRSTGKASSGAASSAAPTIQSAPTQAVLGVRQTRGGLSPHSRAGSSGGAGSNSGSIGSGGSGTGGGTGGGPGNGSNGGSGKPSGTPPGNGKGGTIPKPTTFTPPATGSGPPLAVTVPTPIAAGPTTPGPSTGGDPGGGLGSAAGGGGTGSGGGGGSGGTGGNSGGTGGNPGGTGGNPGGSGGGNGGSGGGNGGAGGGTGGSGGSGGGSGGSGSGGGGNGSGSGSGSGSGGGGSGEPLTKDDCKNGGYTHFGFPNQGQCIAYVEHKQHH